MKIVEKKYGIPNGIPLKNVQKAIICKYLTFINMYNNLEC
jgi:hypothetical protein